MSRSAVLRGNVSSPPPCFCFSTCDVQSANEFTRHIPASVSTSSLWAPYVSAVYGEGVRFPVDIRSFNWFYHNDQAWRASYPKVEWPMASCVLAAPKLGSTGYSRRSSRAKAAVPIGASCAASVCSRWWFHGEQSRIASMVDEISVLPSVEAGASSGVLLFGSLGGNDTAIEEALAETGARTLFQLLGRALVADGEWAEVIRSAISPAFHWLRPEGTCQYGCWFFLARGSGMYVNVGRSWRVKNKGELARPQGAHLHTSSLSTLQQLGQASLPANCSNITRMVQTKTKSLETYPWSAHLLGYDTLQERSTANRDLNKSKGLLMHNELIDTSVSCMYGAQPITTCPPVKLRSGFDAQRPCRCTNKLPVLNCRAADPAARVPSMERAVMAKAGASPIPLLLREGPPEKGEKFLTL